MKKGVPIIEQKFDFSKPYFVGIGGIGLSRLAKYFHSLGMDVSGSDLVSNETVEELRKIGVKIEIGDKQDFLSADRDILIHTVAVPENSPIRAAARERGLRQISHFEALSLISRGLRTIAIAGTNGKSTTTTLLGLMLEAAGYDPLVFVGSKVPAWGGNVRLGRGEIFVVEADELQRQFMALDPYAVVLTNIEADHLDYFHDLADIRSAFVDFVKKIPPDGFFAFNTDDPICREVAIEVTRQREVTFGSDGRTVKLENISVAGSHQNINISIRGKSENFRFPAPGVFNAYNAAAAIAASVNLGADFKTIKPVLENFKGLWRRFETVGNYKGKLLISDYAHHPTSVFGTIAAAKQFYPGKKILVVFQPHQRKRTRAFLNEFADILAKANPDRLIISEIFDVAGRDDRNEAVSSLDLLEKISRVYDFAEYGDGLARTENLVRERIGEFDIVLFIGAGDIYTLPIKLASESAAGH